MRTWIMALALAVAVAVALPGLAQASDLELSSFQVAATDNAALGTRASVEFNLRNTSPRPLTMDSLFGVFLAVKVTAPQGRQPLRRNLGKSHLGRVLAPGQSLSFREILVLDQPGTWQLTPAYDHNGRLEVFDQQARILIVGASGVAISAPAARASGAISAPAPARCCASSCSPTT